MEYIKNYIHNWKQNIEHLTFYFRSFNMYNDIEDLTAEAILKIQKTKPIIKSQKHFDRIVRYLVYQLLIDEVRKNNTKYNYQPNKNINPEFGLDEKYFLGIIEFLSKKKKEAIKLRIQGYSYEEISDVLGINVGAVKSNIFKSRKILKEKYHEEITNYYHCSN